MTELKNHKHVKSAYEAAMMRFSHTDYKKSEMAQESQPAAWKKHSVYDQSLFVNCDEVGEQELPAIDPMEPERELNPDEDRITPPEVVESLTFPKLPDIEPENFPVKIHYHGPVFDYGGYARMNRTYIFGLRDLGVLIKLDPYHSINNVNQPTQEALQMLTTTNVPPDCPKIFGMTIPGIVACAGRKILYTMMETSKKVHYEYADRLNLADEIWTPSTWNKETFEASGVYPEIRVMPLGVDTDRYRPGVEPMVFKDVRSFRFLSASGWSYRKGFDVLVRAYLDEFSYKDDVTMILSTRYAGGLSDRSKAKMMNDLAYIRALVKKPDDQLPHMVLHSTYTPEARMPSLYNSAHAFALISRGEGWGLPYCEAGACGLPVIASDHGGQRDFLDDEVAYMVPPSSYFVSKVSDPAIKNMAWISHFYENQEFPDYEGESYELVKHHLRHVFENYAEAEKKGAKLRERLKNRFDWKTAITRVYNRLVEVC